MAKKAVKKWIDKADIKEGAYTARAKRMGHTVGEQIAYDKSHKTSEHVKKQMRLAETFRSMARKKKSKRSMID